MYSMSSGRERAICCLIVVVKNKKERPMGYSSLGSGVSANYVALRFLIFKYG